MKIEYYAAAVNADGKIGQLKVTRENGRHVSQVWTGKTYRTAARCEKDLSRLNRHLGRA